MPSPIVGFVVLWAALQAQAPSPAKAPASQETKHLTVVTSTGPAKGGTIPLYVDVTPKPNMHVYAPEQKGFIPVSLKLDPVVKALPAKFPKAEPYKAVDEVQSVYSKTFRIVQEIPASAAGTVKGTLRYQACDDKICYLPVSVPVEWTIGPTGPKTQKR